MINTLDIAHELLLAKEITKSNSVDLNAMHLGYPPLLIMNALHAGKEAGLLEFNSKAKTFQATEGTDALSLKPNENFSNAGSFDLAVEIENLVRYLNKEETDPSAEELFIWTNIDDVVIKIIVLTNPNLAMYDLADLKDRKSVYTFITLKENLDKRWGEKQFSRKAKGKGSGTADVKEQAS